MKAGLKLDVRFGSCSFSFLTVERVKEKTNCKGSTVKNRHEHQRGFSWLFLSTSALLPMERDQKEPSSETNTRTPPPQTATAAPVCPSPYCAVEQSLWYWEESGTKIKQKKGQKPGSCPTASLPLVLWSLPCP